MKACLLVLLAIGVGDSLAQSSDSPKNEAFQCLSEKAWLKEQQFQQPKSIEEAFRAGPFVFPRIKTSPVKGAATLPYHSSVHKDEMQARMAEGTRHLHLMDDALAELYFRDAIRLNPECAGAWLGLVMANERYAGRAMFFLNKAREAKESGDAEKAWLAGYELFFDHSTGADLPQRLNRLASDFRSIAGKGKDNSKNSAQAFGLRYELLSHHFANVPITDAEAKNELIESLVNKTGGKECYVYGVLLWRKAKPDEAEKYGEKLVKGTGSIYAKRLWADACVSNGKLEQAEILLKEIGYKERDFQTDISELHAHQQFRFDSLQALTWVYFHQAKFDDASLLSKQAIQQQRKPGFTALAEVDDAIEGNYLHAWQNFVQLHIAMGQWDEVKSFALAGVDDETGMTAKAMRYYWAGVAAALKGNAADVAQFRQQLSECQKKLQSTPYLNKYDAEITKRLRGLDALQHLSQGRITPFLHQIVDVPVNVMAVLLAKAGALENGVAKLKDALVQTPGSIPWRESLELINKDNKNASLETLASDLNDKITVEESVSSATNPGLKLSDKSGKIQDFSQLNGQPTLLIFFLGQGCPHCIEQLQTFRPHISAFEQSGARIITVGTDTVQQLADGLGSSAELNPDLPYLILADPEMTAFKKWGCFDEYQGKPLHGTFLLDAAGKVVWRDISHDPYTQPVFLLSEFKRLLNSKSPESRGSTPAVSKNDLGE